MYSTKKPIIRIGYKKALILINDEKWTLLKRANGSAELLTPKETLISSGSGGNYDGSGCAVYYLTKRSIELLGNDTLCHLTRI